MTMRTARIIIAFAVAVIVTTILGTFASTQFVLARLVALGVDVPVDVRIATTLQDIAGMGPLYGVLIAVAFAIAMTVAAAVVRLLVPEWRTIASPVAGAAAVLTLLLSLEAVLGMMPIAGARTIGGMAVQVAAGAIGGWALLLALPGPAPRAVAHAA
jgi:hypothetical protein